MVKPPETSIKESLTKSKAVTSDEADRASAVVEKATAADPALMNELNQEPWYQSGVGVFGSGGAVWAVGVLVSQVAANGTEFQNYDHMVVVTASVSLISAVGVLYRRFWPGLKPMFSWMNKKEKTNGKSGS